jgi:BMFP domain-containing protein YqiC
LREENKELKARLSALESQLEALSKPKKRGRRKKADESTEQQETPSE